MNTILQTIIYIGLTILILGAIAGGIFLLEKAISKMKPGKAKDILSKVLECLKRATKSTYQTFTEGLKSKIEKDGSFHKLTEEEAKESMNRTLTTFKELATDEMKQFVEDNKVDLKECVEEIIYDLKNK